MTAFLLLACQRSASPNEAAVMLMIDDFATLDRAWRAALRSAPDARMRLARSLAESLETASSEMAAAARSGVEERLQDPFRDYSQILADAAEELREHPSEESSLDRAAWKLSFLPNVAMGIATGLMGPKGTIKITDAELARIRNRIGTRFGQRVQGPDAINGETPFALAVSLVDGFLLNVGTH